MDKKLRTFKNPPRRKAKEKPSFLYQGYQKLTRVEQDVLHLIVTEFLTTRQVAIRRGTSVRATQLTVQSLKKKGALNAAKKNLRFCDPTSEVFGAREHSIRLHAQHFVIKIIYQDSKYQEIIEKRGNIINIDGHTVKLHSRKVEIYSGTSFFGDDANQATARSFEYWGKFWIRLENDLNCILVKPRVQNIQLVSAHYAETNNELSKQCEVSDEKIRVSATEDGKIWLEMDNSFRLNEAETKHPRTSQRDMQDVVAPFFNDRRDYPGDPPNTSDMMRFIRESHEDLKGLLSVVKSQSEQLGATLEVVKVTSQQVSGVSAALTSVGNQLNALAQNTNVLVKSQEVTQKQISELTIQRAPVPASDNIPVSEGVPYYVG